MSKPAGQVRQSRNQSEGERTVANEFLDHLETREPAVRERSQFGLLPDLVRNAMAGAPG